MKTQAIHRQHIGNLPMNQLQKQAMELIDKYHLEYHNSEWLIEKIVKLLSKAYKKGLEEGRKELLIEKRNNRKLKWLIEFMGGK